MLSCLLLAVSACSQIKSYFPDKEKDYQFKTEIPELVLPPDLSRNETAKSPSPPVSVSVESPLPEPTVATDEDQQIHVERVIYDGGATRLRVDRSFAKTWPIVGKALAREAIEIIARNKPENMYIVMYDPGEQKITDESFWDEIRFVFDKLGGNEREYRIKLAEYEDFTEVIVLDENDKPLSEGAGLSLLLQIQKGIEDDLAESVPTPVPVPSSDDRRPKTEDR